MSEKKLNPKLDEAIANFGDAANVPGPAYIRAEYWTAHDGLLDVIREMLIEMGGDVLRFTDESDGWPPEPKMMRVLADSHLYSGGNDETA